MDRLERDSRGRSSQLQKNKHRELQVVGAGGDSEKRPIQQVDFLWKSEVGARPTAREC